MICYLFSLIKEATTTTRYFCNNPFRTKLNICFENIHSYGVNIVSQPAIPSIYSDSDNTRFNIEYVQVQSRAYSPRMACCQRRMSGCWFFLSYSSHFSEISFLFRINLQTNFRCRSIRAGMAFEATNYSISHRQTLPAICQGIFFLFLGIFNNMTLLGITWLSMSQSEYGEHGIRYQMRCCPLLLAQ